MEAQRIRVGTRIYHAVDDVPKNEGDSPMFYRGDLIGDYKTLNAAKRESRRWQKATGIMGDGRLVTASKPPVRVVAEAA